MQRNVLLQHSSTFEDAVPIFPTNDLADMWNWERLQLLGTPNSWINSYHIARTSETSGADPFRGFQPHLLLALGPRVFVNNNGWTGAGIDNETVGQIVHIQLGVDENGAARTPPHLPDVVFVRMENYRAPQYFEEPLQGVRPGGQVVDLRKVIPIAPISASDDDPSARGRRGGRVKEAGSARWVRT